MAEPAVTIRAVHNSGTGNITPTRVVIHSTVGGGFPGASRSGMARSVANYFTSQASGGSAHYVVDVANEEHCLPDDVVAWHAPPNEHSIGIEIASEPSYTREQWLDPAVYPVLVKAAARTRELCDRFGIPLVKLSSADLLAGRHGVCGHVDVSQAWHQSTHWDPGPAFPWDVFMELVGGAAVSTPGPAPAPPPSPATPARLAWSLPAGHWYGNLHGPAKQHGGYYAAEQGAVRNIQQWLIYHGCVPGVPSSAWASSGWADGRWENATDGPMVTWHSRFYSGQKFPAQCWADDYDRLARP